MKRVLITATVQSHVCQFHRALITLLHEVGYDVHVAARDNLAEKNGLRLDFVEKVYDLPFSRSPIDKDNISCYKLLKTIINNGNYNIIHCNTPVGGIITRLAARKARKKGTQVFYTAHGFHFYKGAPLRNWIVYYPIERLFARFTDKLIAITKEDYLFAQRKFHTNVCYVHGVGADSSKYHCVSREKMMELRKELGFNEYEIILLCTGELNDNKNQCILIRAFTQLCQKYPELRLLLAGNGPKEQAIKSELLVNNLSERVNMLGYRTDLEKFTKACDIVVSASIREGLPLNIMEAMLCGKPVVVSRNRGHCELVHENITGLFADAASPDSFAEALSNIIENEELMNSFCSNTIHAIIPYTKEAVSIELKQIYGVV